MKQSDNEKKMESHSTYDFCQGWNDFPEGRQAFVDVCAFFEPRAGGARAVSTLAASQID